MTKIEKKTLTGERALFATRDAEISECIFCDGESPLKESEKLNISRSRFSWKYPLWYCREVKVRDSVLDVTARSGIWYTHGIEMTGCEINAPKTFRRSSDITVRSSRIPNAEETMWSCRGAPIPQSVRANKRIRVIPHERTRQNHPSRSITPASNL